ncbi:D-alanyl-D-alanine carboxypeptidase/D-alanyl-D-alanine-endopeptidase (penicillin-binding protein 4) [Nitrosospira sp. Nsp5]|uniref:D-alanyl-D-alanine carboxypeptidase / D-alanyl-D-alanine-endopeptidase (Penicillin-binding protein 4) n=1 Tax=Nitrosospira multiformis TaxID=1231 RepID=A0ABY0T771_9PROT|nr:MULTISPECIES: D-alanyl-D-alanine carboxypeptidase/D-alanyl-D-alanine-endopeptidase [Nitrosospira]PTR09656.1 D-alanyl-D-alanine carboxypeptidase/D-alanyl-D-alanine-endopeptidase (penicillin-binding protein 4) [Nitrosospira sp. Nsp5]SDQ25280.1 D-alanyl-D-alanine carboxypeptidase / D-alanyl-D-alanine-endopeptidase (penicillin-binding protein 4) [Nitrosospira multiformis]
MADTETHYNGYTGSMAHFRIAIVLCAVLAAAPLPAFSYNIPVPVSQALKQAGIPQSAVGIYVQEIGATKPLLAVNTGTPMNPASVMKLVTTFAGLELLGPAYTWKTELYADGTLEGGTLRGNLVIKGYGDPKLNLENFWLLTRRLRQTGLHEITGDLVLDSSHFDLPSGNPAAFDGKPHRAYNVLPEALLVNYRTLALRLIPQPGSKTVRIVVDPSLPSLELKNSLKLTNGPCNEWRDALDADIRTTINGNVRVSIALNGSYSTNCGEKTLYLSVHDTADYIFGLFRQLWEEQGGIFRGNVRTGITPEGMTPLETHQSPPLADIVRDINKFSNNTAARQLYLALGLTSALTAKLVTGLTADPAAGLPPRVPAGGVGNTIPDMAGAYDKPPATLAKSEMALRRWLASKRLSFPELVIENGSGLSRNERISTGHLGALLLAAFQSPVMPEFISSLPIAAVDGTMKKRLNDSATAGQAHIKTGLLDGVRTMAGYVLDKSGRRVAVVFFINHPKSGIAQPAMDALLHWTYERP